MRKLDEVAYVRFASVYKEFHDAGSFVKEVESLVKTTPVSRAERSGQVELFESQDS